MGILDPKPVTDAALDTAVRDKINQAGSATEVALTAAIAAEAFMTTLIFGD